MAESPTQLRPVPARLWLILALVCGLAMAAACQEEPGSTLVARVGSSEIHLPDFWAQATFINLGGDATRFTPELRRSVLETLIREYLILAEAQAQGIQLEPEELEREERLLRKGLNQVDFEAALTAQGLEYASWREALRRKLLVRKTLDLVLAPKVKISPAEVEAYYKAHQEQFSRPAQVLAQHAVLHDKAKAEALIDLVLRGQDMAQAAAELGAPLVEGGEALWLGRGHMPQSLEDKVFALKPGQVAGPVESAYGIHVVRVLAKREGGQVPMSEAADKIMHLLSNEKMENLAADWVDQLRDQSEVWMDSGFLATGRTGAPGGNHADAS